MADYGVFGVLFVLLAPVALHFIAKVNDPDIRREMRYLAWVFFALGMIGFLIYEARHPPKNGWEETPGVYSMKW